MKTSYRPRSSSVRTWTRHKPSDKRPRCVSPFLLLMAIVCAFAIAMWIKGHWPL